MSNLPYPIKLSDKVIYDLKRLDGEVCFVYCGYAFKNLSQLLEWVLTK